MIRRLTTLIALLSLAACAANTPNRSESAEDRRLPAQEAKKEAELDDTPVKVRAAEERQDAASAGRPAMAPSKEEVQAPPAADKLPAPPRDAPVESVQSEPGGGLGLEGDVWEEVDPRAELDGLVQELSEQLDEARKDGVTQNQPPGALRCEEVCDLSEGVCTSSEKICGIAQRHPAEPYFADRCAWSGRECAQASERCRRCAPR